MDAFAATCESIARTSSRLEKVRLAAEWLESLDDDSLGIGAVFLSAAPFARSDARRPGIGGGLLMRAGVQLTGVDGDTLRAHARSTGDLGETLGELSTGHVKPEPFGLTDARAAFEALAREPLPAHKVTRLVDTWRRLTSRAVKFFVKVATGTLRIGFMEKQVEEALAQATGRPVAEIRRANALTGDLEAVARAARANRLGEIRAKLFQPIDFMLASPLASVAEIEAPGDWWVEAKLDGIRAQAHVDGDRVAIYSRGLGEVTAAFPEVADRLRALTGPAVLDGELVATDGERSLSFQVLQRRLSRKAPTPQLIDAVPVAFVSWDLLHDATGLLVDEPFEARRQKLDAVLRGHETWGLRAAKQWEASAPADIERLFDEAKAAGDEGLVLKRRGSKYEAGRRGGAWVKLKATLGTLDVVITRAEQGQGRRNAVLSDYTFAVRAAKGLAELGRTYSGLPDEEVRRLSDMLEELTIDRRGGVRLVRPELVLEVTFDSVQKSTRYESGYALRFPRIVRWRTDKQPFQADTIETVEVLYAAELNAGRISTRATTPPPARTQQVDDLPLFEGGRKPE